MYDRVKKMLSFGRGKTLVILGVLLGTPLALCLLYLWWELPHWLLTPSQALLEPDELLKLENDLRSGLTQVVGGVAQIVGGAALLIGLFFTWRNLRVAEENLRLSQQTTEKNLALAREGQITDRFTRAINQLGESGAEKLAVRLGGIYALEQISESAEAADKYHWPIMEVLIAYVREKSPRLLELEEDDSIPPKLAADIQAILTVIGRRTRTYEKGENQALELYEVCLSRANLRHANLSGAILDGAILRMATLDGAILDGADLNHANLRGAFLGDAFLHGADLSGADLRRATLYHADLSGADLSGADLSGADLCGATLVTAQNLTKEQIQSATIDEDTRLPDDLKAQL